MSLLRTVALFSRPLASPRVIAQRASFASVNRLTLVGTVGRDPEVKAFENGNSIVNISVATDEWVPQGQEHETTWHKVSVFSPKTGQYVMDYIRKGDVVFVEGKLKLRKYVNREGFEVATYVVNASGVSKIRSSQKNREARDYSEEAN